MPAATMTSTASSENNTVDRDNSNKMRKNNEADNEEKTNKDQEKLTPITASSDSSERQI